MPITIASIFNLMGPDMLVVLLIVLLLFGAKKLPELARGMGRAVKEFSAAREEIDRELTQVGSNRATHSKLLNTNGDLPAALEFSGYLQHSRDFPPAASQPRKLNDRPGET
jgi:sec-independent protein translocase protein TatA